MPDPVLPDARASSEARLPAALHARRRWRSARFAVRASGADRLHAESVVLGRGQRGQALAAFAIVLPLMVLFIAGLLDVGRIVYINNAVAQGAREGARWGSVQGRVTTVDGRAAIASEVRARMVAVPAPTVSVLCEPIAAPSGCTSGDIIAVFVRSDVSPMTPIIGDLIGPLSVSSTARMTISQ